MKFIRRSADFRTNVANPAVTHTAWRGPAKMHLTDLMASTTLSHGPFGDQFGNFGIAQSVEQVAVNHPVGGSNPSAEAKI